MLRWRKIQSLNSIFDASFYFQLGLLSFFSRVSDPHRNSLARRRMQVYVQESIQERGQVRNAPRKNLEPSTCASISGTGACVGVQGSYLEFGFLALLRSHMTKCLIFFYFRFNSPRYPSNYPSSTNCTYLFFATPREQVIRHSLIIIYLLAHCCHCL